jgi:hypothetical protein
MAQTALTVVQLKQNNYAVVAGDLTITLAAMDNVNGNSFVATGKEILLFANSDATPHAITITSVSDNYGRTDASMIAYSMAISPGLEAIEMSQLVGWAGAGSLVTMTTTSALVKIAVLRHQ